MVPPPFNNYQRNYAGMLFGFSLIFSELFQDFVMLEKTNIFVHIPFGELIVVRHYIRCNKEPNRHGSKKAIMLQTLRSFV